MSQINNERRKTILALSRIYDRLGIDAETSPRTRAEWLSVLSAIDRGIEKRNLEIAVQRTVIDYLRRA